MSKYIDAEKLKKFVGELKNEAKRNCYDSWGIVPEALEEVESFITSLQQEQPDAYDRAMHEVKAKVDKLYDEASIGLSEYDSGLYNGIAETCMKLRGFIKARISSDEQPEVDLGKEITPSIVENMLCEFGVQSIDDMDSEKLAEFARHFYGLRNRALEEAARHVYESWMGGTMDDVRRDMAELGKVLNAGKEE